MAKAVYEKSTITLLDGSSVEISPLKIKYLRKFMDIFYLVDFVSDEVDAITVLSECATICMHQHYPSIQTREQLEDLVDLPTIYHIIDVCAGIKIDPDKEDIEQQAKEQSKEEKGTWKDLDLAELEAEVFQVGAWKNFDEIEEFLTMKELIAILEQKRENDYNDKKFYAAMQGVDLDKQSGQTDKWEEMKSRVFSGGQTTNPDDILTYQGYKAQQAGFGIGMGLDYVDMKSKPAKSD